MNFRMWCSQMWYEHCDEVYSWTGQAPTYLSAEYFGRYKWWLRREFRSVVSKQQALTRRIVLDLD